MRQYLTAALVAFVAVGACGLFALGMFFASAIILIRAALMRLEDWRDALRARLR